VAQAPCGALRAPLARPALALPRAAMSLSGSDSAAAQRRTRRSFAEEILLRLTRVEALLAHSAPPGLSTFEKFERSIFRLTHAVCAREAGFCKPATVHDLRISVHCERLDALEAAVRLLSEDIKTPNVLQEFPHPQSLNVPQKVPLCFAPQNVPQEPHPETLNVPQTVPPSPAPQNEPQEIPHPETLNVPLNVPQSLAPQNVPQEISHPETLNVPQNVPQSLVPQNVPQSLAPLNVQEFPRPESLNVPQNVPKCLTSPDASAAKGTPQSDTGIAGLGLAAPGLRAVCASGHASDRSCAGAACHPASATLAPRPVSRIPPAAVSRPSRAVPSLEELCFARAARRAALHPRPHADPT